jgi:hypothetical protein
MHSARANLDFGFALLLYWQALAGHNRMSSSIQDIDERIDRWGTSPGTHPSAQMLAAAKY